MGKDSLIKSTAAKSGTKKKKSAAKKTVAKKSAATKTKSKKNTPAAGQTATPAPTKSAGKLTIKELLFKQFESQAPPVVDAPPQPDRSRMTAPPFISSDDPAEVQRLRSLLSQRFSMEEIRAAAKAPVEMPSAPPAAPAATPPATASPTPADLQDKPETESITAPETVAEPEPEIEPETPVAPEPVPDPTPEPAPTTATEQTIESVVAPETPSTPPPAPEPKPEPKPAPETAAAEQPSSTAVHAASGAQTMEEPPVKPQTSSSAGSSATDGASSDPVMRAMKIGIAVLGLIVLLLLWASFANSTRYYMDTQRESVAVWKGAFSPTGKRLVAVIPGAQIAEPATDVYSRKEVYPLIFNHHLERADTLLAAGGLPDFPAIHSQLDTAEGFALNKEMRTAVNSRRTNLQRTQLIHQAHVEISKDTLASLAVALQNLRQAQRLTTDTTQLETTNQIITLVNERRAALQAQIEAQSQAEEAPAN
ncbi:MAG: hypothetical protein KFF50_16960 [Desulfatitalea sp.]|nr:hypothetical protein [Desulfatitalea sp.]